MVTFRTILTIVIVSSLLLFFSQTWVTAYTDRIIAVVNKEVITLSELKEEVRDEHIRLKARFTGAELKERMANKEFEVLNTLIEERLQLQEAKANGLTVRDEEVEKALRKSSTQAQFHSKSETEITELMRKRILLDKVRTFEVRRTVTISDSEISQHYKEHQQLYMTSPAYRLRQILFLAESEEDRVHKHTQAKSVFRRLQGGEGFRELALQYSGGPEAAEGGELGLVQHNELLSPIAEALLTMKPGEISPPIETALGFHIISLDERTPSQPKPLEDVENQIKSRLLKERSEQVFQRWLADLKKKAFIEIKYVP